ncbi:MAG: hypothetical protein LBJ41_02905 [Treponema sp.]|jgi:hypothetical protein|nr:hypothetical protein [Treponema sp.]
MALTIPVSISALEWSLLSSGSWEYEGKLVTREDVGVFLPWDLSLRAQLIDSRESIDTANIAFSGGLYHKASGSRLLYGILDDSGLSARLRNLWSHAVPFVENHKPSSLELATTPSSTKSPSTALFLGTPRFGDLAGFASLVLDEAFNPAVSGGIAVDFDKETTFQLESFYTRKELPPRSSSTWFSSSPPLPARDFELYALSAVYTSTFFDIASDWALSKTFAYGQGVYGNLALGIGSRPWRVSLAADGAGERYVGSDGDASSAGFRLGARFEYFWKRSSTISLSTTLRTPKTGVPFDRSSSLITYHFSTKFNVKLGPVSLNPSYCSLGFSRDATNWAKVKDKAEASFGLNLGPIHTALSGNAVFQSVVDTQPALFPQLDSSTIFASAKVASVLSWGWGIARFSAALGYTLPKNKDAVWDTSFRASIQGKRGRLSLGLVSPVFPDHWTFTLSWRFSKPR